MTTDRERQGGGEAEQLILKLVGVAQGFSFMAAVPEQDIAALIVSHLAAHPEHIRRFLVEGAELLIDGTIRPETGCLSYRAECGDILTPRRLRQIKGEADQ